MKNLYRRLAAETGVKWSGRNYKADDFLAGDGINQALSAAHYSLYGVVLAVIHALGCSPGLGFIHTGNQRSFVFDVADLYKAETSIPIAFQVVSEQPEDIPTAVRKAMRQVLYDRKTIPRMVKDIYGLFEFEEEEQEFTGAEVLSLWDYRQGIISGGINYAASGEVGA